MASTYPRTTDMTGLPLDDTRALLAALPAFDEAAATAATAREASLYHEPRERGRLSILASWLSGWRATPAAPISKIDLCLFAGCNGWPSQAALARAQTMLKTRLMLLSAGGSAASVQAGQMKAGLRVFELAIDQPTADAATSDAMSELDCARTLAFGLEAISQQPDVLVLHGFGAAGREVAAAMAMSLFGGQAEDWLAGAGADLAEDFTRSASVVDRMVRRVSESPADALDLLRRIGSRELAALVGAILAARLQKIPVVLDGFEATVAAALLFRMASGAIDHCLISGRDGSVAHDRLIEQLRMEPVLDLQLQGGDGLGGLVAADLLRTAMTLHLGLASKVQAADLVSNGAGQPH